MSALLRIPQMISVWIHLSFSFLSLWWTSTCQLILMCEPKTLLMKNTAFSCSPTYKIWIYFLVNLNGAYPKLVPFRPAGQLISPPLLLSVIVNILFSLAMHIVGFILVQRQPWYSMDMHRYDHRLDSPHWNFYQKSSGPCGGKQMGLHCAKGFDFLKPLGEFSSEFLFSVA